MQETAGFFIGAYQITTGLNSYVSAAGWGSNPWGDSTWGSGSGIGVSGQLRLYSQDNFGEDLIFNARNSGIFYWDSSSGLTNRAINITQSGGAYQITTGLNSYVSAAGWGSNPWGDSTWGSGSGIGVSGQLRLYSQDNFGEDLIFNARNSGIFYWGVSNYHRTK